MERPAPKADGGGSGAKPRSVGIAGYILFQKFDDFVAYLFPIVDRFPHKEKFALCTQIKNTCYEIVRNIIDAHRAKDKYVILYRVDGQLEFLRWLLSHSHGRGYLAHHSFETSSRLVNEVGKIVGRLLNPGSRKKSGSPKF